jgi:hypothetical protein
VSEPRPLDPGPWHKSPAWRGGAFLVGLAGLLIIVDWVLGGLVDIGVGSVLLVLVLAGVALSAPFGLGLWRRPEPERRPAELVPQARVDAGEAGSTYVIVAPVEPAPAPAPPGPRTRVRELSGGWYILYSVFWRLPVLMGDYALTGLWRLVAHIRGTRSERRTSDLHLEGPDAMRRPDRETF